VILLVISQKEKKQLQKTIDHFPLSITPYYFSLIDRENYQNDPVFRQAFADTRELYNSKSEMTDPLAEDHDSPVPLITHRYPDRVLFLVSNVCAMYCRHCTRKRKVGDIDNIPTRKQIREGLDYIRNTPQVRDVLLSGGDPFLLSDFLEENEINWNATYNDLSFSVKNSRILSYNGEGKIPKLDKKVKQYHVYTYNHESILKSNNIPNFYILWGKLFNSLFKPSMRLVIEIKNTKFEKGKYIAVHFRFVNALDSFEEGYYNSLSKSYSEKLINRCLKILFQLKQEFDGKEILVFSDSQRFVRITQEKGFPTLSGKIGHISFLGDDLNVVLKTFVDFYMIAGAYQVYRAYSPEMYKSGFSYYAALVGGKEAIECSIP